MIVEEVTINIQAEAGIQRQISIVRSARDGLVSSGSNLNRPSVAPDPDQQVGNDEVSRLDVPFQGSQNDSQPNNTLNAAGKPADTVVCKP